MYWSDQSLKRISRSQCLTEGTSCQSEPIVTHLVDTVSSLAVDTVTQLLYWVDSGRRRIELMKIPAGPRTVLVWRDLDSPRAITLHHDSGSACTYETYLTHTHIHTQTQHLLAVTMSRTL